MEGGEKIANIQKPVDYNSVEPKLELIDLVREATLKNIDDYFKNRGILIDNLLDYLKKPTIYHGTSIGLKQIIEWFIDKSVSKYYKKIQTKGLSIKYVINTIRENLFQGGWEVKRRSNIIITSREINNSQEVINTVKINDTPRLLITQNKDHKVRPRPKPKSKIPSKGKIKEVKNERGRKRLCEYCGSNIRRRVANEILHINIGQNPTHHYFCSKECKTEWIYASQMR